MMIDHLKRMSKLVEEELDRLALATERPMLGFYIVPTISPIPTPDGRMAVGTAWLITVTYRNVFALGGAPDFSSPDVIPGVMPPDALVKIVVGRLLEQVREERDKDKAAALAGAAAKFREAEERR